MIIPEDYIEFLYWFKEETEKSWQYISVVSDESYLFRAKWIGLTENQIDQVEKKYNISFTQEHKEFLKILHAIDKKKPTEYYDENGEVYVKDDPYFCNWLTDEEDIIKRLNWPYEWIFNDIKNHFWLKFWGERPNSEEEMEKIFSDWYHKAPKLIPIHAHRFVVSQTDNIKTPVLSMWGSDTIIYGWSMKHYLLNELGDFLPIHESVYDEEDEDWYPEYIQEAKKFKNLEWERGDREGIPYWYELIKAANSS